MDFALPAAAEAWRSKVLAYAKENLADSDVVRRDADSEFWMEGWRRCAELGIQGLPIPKAYGGQGANLTSTIAAMEALGFGCLDLGLVFAINAHLWAGAVPLLHFGSEEQKKQFLPGMCDGSIIGANAASEPEAGSDVFSMQTRAERVGNEYVLNGVKMFVGNAPIAGVIVTYAVTKPNAGPFGVSAFLVQPGVAGMTIGPNIRKLGIRTCNMSRVTFDNCRIPASALLGKEGSGSAAFNCSMEWERGGILAMHLGSMQRHLENCIAHARTRKQFGKLIGSFQSVANRIVDMKVRLDAARMLIYRIGWRKDRGENAMLDAAIAKLFLADAAVQSGLDVIQVFGGYGYLTETGIERELRDAVGASLYSGTTEIQKNIVARMLGLPPST